MPGTNPNTHTHTYLCDGILVTPPLLGDPGVLGGPAFLPTASRLDTPNYALMHSRGHYPATGARRGEKPCHAMSCRSVRVDQPNPDYANNLGSLARLLVVRSGTQSCTHTPSNDHMARCLAGLVHHVPRPK